MNNYMNFSSPQLYLYSSMPAMNVIRVVEVVDETNIDSILNIHHIKVLICCNKVSNDINTILKLHGITLYDEIKPENIGKTINKVAINYRIHVDKREEGFRWITSI